LLQFEGDDWDCEGQAGVGAEGAGLCAELFYGQVAVFGHSGGECGGGAVVVDACEGLMNGDDTVGCVLPDEVLYDAGLRLGEGNQAGGGGVDAVGGLEIAVEVDAGGVFAGVLRQAIGVGEGQEYDCAAVEQLKVVVEVLRESADERGPCGLIAVDGGHNQDDIGSPAEYLGHNGRTASGTANDVVLAEQGGGGIRDGAKLRVGRGLLAAGKGQHRRYGTNRQGGGASVHVKFAFCAPSVYPDFPYTTL